MKNKNLLIIVILIVSLVTFPRVFSLNPVIIGANSQNFYINNTNIYINNTNGIDSAGANATYVLRLDWTTHDNYPSACSAGQFVSQVGDTLTCSIPASSNNLLNVCFLNNTQVFTLENNFTNKTNFFGNVNITSNLTIQNISIRDLKTCTLKTDALGNVFCGTDNTGTGSSFSNAISNLTALISTDSRITITADFNPDNNRTINLTLPNIPYNVSVVHRDSFNNITDANISCLNILKTIGGDTDLCNDATSSSSFSNAVSNLTALVDVTKGINITSLTPDNNQTIFIRLNSSNEALLNNESSKYLQLNTSSTIFLYNGSFNSLIINSSTLNALNMAYNHTIAMTTIPNIWTAPQTFNMNMTYSGGNVTFNFVNQYTTYEKGNVSIGTNNTAFKICAWNTCDIWYRP